MNIAIHGLGRMGMQIARKLAENPAITLIAHNRTPDKLAEAAAFGAHAAASKADVVAAFGDQPVVLWLMLPAEVVDEQLAEWLAVLPAGSLLIDGGNSDYRLSQRRAADLAAAGHHFVDVGVSGGIWGYQNACSMIVGADRATDVDTLEPVLTTLAAPDGAYHHFGPAGAGHFVKMTHNAIEYGMMESLAEGYQLLKHGPYAGLDLAAAASVWQHHSVVTSWLNELCGAALQQNPELSGIDGLVHESGEARWALETANAERLPMPAIQAAFDVRLASQTDPAQRDFRTKLLAAMRAQFGGHDLNT